MAEKRSQESIDREAFYDAEIAPVLAQLHEQCATKGLTFLAVVEWDSKDNGGEWPTYGRTWGKPDTTEAGLGVDVSDLLLGMNELAKRGYLCKSITSLTISRTPAP